MPGAGRRPGPGGPGRRGGPPRRGGPGGFGRPGGFRGPGGPGFHRPPPPPPPPPRGPRRPYGYGGGCMPGCLVSLLGLGGLVALLAALVF